MFLLRSQGLVIRLATDVREKTGVATESQPNPGSPSDGRSRRGRRRGTLEKRNEPDRHGPGGVNPVRAQTYEITFLGQAGNTLRAEFDDCEVTIGPGTTTLRAELPDRGALSGLIERISSLGLDVIDVSLVALPPGR